MCLGNLNVSSLPFSLVSNRPCPCISFLYSFISDVKFSRHQSYFSVFSKDSYARSCKGCSCALWTSLVTSLNPSFLSSHFPIISCIEHIDELPRLPSLDLVSFSLNPSFQSSLPSLNSLHLPH
ncbi:hypothetical protein GEMRC1_006060 [Eukaryota sp. GEM-RC1]